MSFKKIDIDNWSRKNIFHLFKEYEDPFFNITANIDATELFLHCKKTKESFFLSTLFASNKTVNSIDNFKMRIKDDEVILYDTIHCGSTVLHDDQSFTFCYFEFFEDRIEFLQKGKKTLEKHLANPFLDPGLNQLDMIHHSTLPWIHFTQFKHARRGKGQQDSIPKITFGQAKETSSGRYELPISVAVNHALADGFHVGQFFDKIQNEFTQF